MLRGISGIVTLFATLFTIDSAFSAPLITDRDQHGNTGSPTLDDATPLEPESLTLSRPWETGESDASTGRRWYLHVGAVNAYPRLESELLVRKLFNPAMRALAPGFDDVTTVGTLRDRGLLWQPQIGLGYILSDKWTWSFQTGWISGKVRTQASDRSWLFGLPLKTDFEIKRSAAFFGTGFDYYPFGIPQQRPYSDWEDRLKGSRPYIGGSVTATYATFRAKVKIGLANLPNLGIELSDAWLVYSMNLHVGWEIPFDEKSGLLLNVGMNRFDRQRHDFEGLAISVEWKRILGWQSKN